MEDHSQTPLAPDGGTKPLGVTPELIDRLTGSILADRRMSHIGEAPLPSRDSVGELVEMVRWVVFPGFFGPRGLKEETLREHIAGLVSRIQAHAEEQVRAALRYMEGLQTSQQPMTAAAMDRSCEDRARSTACAFVEQLPELRRLLSLDVLAAYEGDPAAVHTDETIFCYPGIDAIFSHRVAHVFYLLGVPLLPRLISEMAHGRTGIDIHPGARIGESFFIDHGGGTVIGETTVIGHHVRIYQGVTLGARSFEKDAHGRLVKGRQRHPTIGNRVTIYAGAVILGGDTVIGDDCVISGSVFVMKSVPPGHLARYPAPQLELRAKNTME